MPVLLEDMASSTFPFLKRIALGVLFGTSIGLVGCGELTEGAGDAMVAYVSANQGEIVDMGGAKTAIRSLAGTVVNELITGTPAPPPESEYKSLQDEYDSKSDGAWDIPSAENLGNRVLPEPYSIPEIPPPPPGQSTR